MQDNLCPICLKNGVKKKIKLLQINLQEGVWVCEEEKVYFCIYNIHILLNRRISFALNILIFE